MHCRIKYFSIGTGTIAQFVKCLLHKHEDLSLIVKNPSEKKKQTPGTVADAYKTRAGKGGGGRMLSPAGEPV